MTNQNNINMDNFDLRKYLTENKITSGTRLQEEDRPNGFQISSVDGNIQMRGDGFLPYTFEDQDWKQEMIDSIFDTFASEIAYAHDVDDADDIYDSIEAIIKVNFDRGYFDIVHKDTQEEIGTGEYQYL